MTLTRHQKHIVDAAVSITLDAPTDEDKAFMARQLVQATLPHKNPGDVPVWTRKNGNLTLVVQPGWNTKTNQSFGYPYGTIPRLLLFWITTEAVQKKSKRLELGDSLAGFMEEVGLSSTTGGGKRGDATRLKDQMARLLRASISFQQDIEEGGREGLRYRDMRVSDDGMLWWDYKEPSQRTLWGSWLELTPRFYEAVTANPIPVDTRALRALKRSPLALDLYSWLTYEAFRAHQKRTSRFVSWGLLMNQFGTDYATESDFRRKVKAALTKIRMVYPGLKLGDRLGGIEVLPTSLTAIRPRPSLELDKKPTS